MLPMYVSAVIRVLVLLQGDFLLLESCVHIYIRISTVIGQTVINMK